MNRFARVLQQAAQAAGIDVTASPAPPRVQVLQCAVCRNVIETGDLCQKCAREVQQGYAVRSLAGRCANGAERDHGTRFHALPITGQRIKGRALCGAAPSGRSAGWSEWGHGEPVTCPRCIQKIETIRLREEQGAEQ